MDEQNGSGTEARTKRRWLAVTLVILIVLVGAGTAVWLTLDRVDTPTARALPSPNENDAAAFAGPPPILVYADFASALDLHHLDLTTGDDSVTATLPMSGQTQAAFGSTWMSIEVPEVLDGGGVQPVIHIFDPEAGTSERLGVGVDPTWSPDGTRLAWAEPTDPEDCGEAACRGDLSIVVTTVDTGVTETLGGPGRYSIVDWAGDHLLVQDSAIPEQPILQSVSPDGTVSALPVLPADYWGVSPDGRLIVESIESGVTRFLEMADGEVTGAGEDIGIRAGTKLGTGAWSHDSSAIAAFALGDDGLEFVTFSPGSPQPVTLTEGGEASTGATFWSPDNDAVVFQRFNGNELEAVHCPLADPTACEAVLSWTTGVALLRIE